MIGKLAIIIVSHNSKKYVENCLNSILNCEVEFSQIILVDSGSTERDYLNRLGNIGNMQIYYMGNVGFCKANNTGYSKISRDIEYVLFVNPDVYLEKNIIIYLVKEMERSRDLFAISPKLLRFSFERGKLQKSNIIDSNGIASTFYGRYYDINKNYNNNTIQYTEAICGAFMLCKRKALDEISRKGKIFNEKLYMYKEDIELCLYAKSCGYRCGVLPSVIAYHGRGWKKRRDIERWQKEFSSRNDFFLLTYMNGVKKCIAFLYYAIKYFYVKLFE